MWPALMHGKMPAMMDPHAHCGFCGAPFASGQVWPRICAACECTTFRNPAPVAVVLLPVDDGLLVVQRAIAPARGEWALPGGFLDIGETWQEGAVRELYEETGLQLDPGTAEMVGVRSTPGGRHVLLFTRLQAITRAHLPVFVGNAEVSAIEVIHEPRELAFPLHTEMCRVFFTG